MILNYLGSLDYVFTYLRNIDMSNNEDSVMIEEFIFEVMLVQLHVSMKMFFDDHHFLQLILNILLICMNYWKNVLLIKFYATMSNWNYQKNFSPLNNEQELLRILLK